MHDVTINPKVTPYDLFVSLKNHRNSKSSWWSISENLAHALNLTASRYFGVQTRYSDDDYRLSIFTIQYKRDTIVIRCYQIDSNPYVANPAVLKHLYVWEFKCN